MKNHTGNSILKLMDTHEELWRIVDGLHSADETEVIAAARKNSTIVKARSSLLEEIDEILIRRTMQARAEHTNMDRSKNSMAETFGSLIDKICINRLKIYHYKEKRDALDAAGAEASAIEGKLAILEEQGQDLAEELDTLLEDVISGRKDIKVYRQFKM